MQLDCELNELHFSWNSIFHLNCGYSDLGILWTFSQKEGE